jgi:TRAP-type mannitol/chloroaromatic compound transport system permease large subunit
MALGVAFGYFALGDVVIQLVVQRTYSIMTNDVLISGAAVTFMGYIIDRSNTLDRMFKERCSSPLAASQHRSPW